MKSSIPTARVLAVMTATKLFEMNIPELEKNNLSKAIIARLSHYVVSFKTASMLSSKLESSVDRKFSYYFVPVEKAALLVAIKSAIISIHPPDASKVNWFAEHAPHSTEQILVDLLHLVSLFDDTTALEQGLFSTLLTPFYLTKG
jgi:hypothetical protein